MKKYLFFLIFSGFSSFAQVNSNNSESNKTDEAIPFNKVDQIPLFENCKNLTKDFQRECMVNAINLHIEKTMQYPAEAKRVKVESKVYCTFIIDKVGKTNIVEASGKPTSFKKPFENEAKRIINTLPKFIPGKHENELVNVKCVIVIEFSLGEKVEVVYQENPPVIVMSEVKIVAEPEYTDEAFPFAVLEQIPLFETCKNAEKTKQRECFQEEMKKHIEKHLKYPKEAKKNKITARAIVLFEITKEGNVSNIKTRITATNKVYSADFEVEALRIINKLPQFIPGKHRGKVVAVSYAIPIVFSLTDK